MSRLRLVPALPLCLLLLAVPADDRLQGSPTRSDPTSLAELLPARAGEYSPREPDGTYDRETLFSLIDGGAEVYRSFGVRTVVSRRYGKTGAPDILADLFDMGSARGAYGAYHHDLREGREAGLGRESEMAGGTLAFWKDRYFVSLVALGETAQTDRGLRELGRAIDAAIPRRGEIPEVVRLLPRDGPPPVRTSYFLDWTYLNTRYFIAETDLLRLEPGAEGVLARYPGGEGSAGAGGEPFVLMLVRYPDEARAAQSLGRFQADYLAPAGADGSAVRPGGGWAGARVSGRLLIAVLEAPKKPDLDRLAGSIGNDPVLERKRP
jgi:hypothetical protein